MDTAWIPPPEVIARAQVTRLARELGCADFAALQRFSVAQPEAYWRHLMGFLRIAWSRDPTGYVSLPDGPAFPDWFPDGELNWVDTIFGWGRDPARRDRPAIIAECEDGTVRSITWGEMEARVLSFAAGLRARGLQRGDRIGLLMEGGIEAVVTFLGISALGAICVPLFSGFGVDAIVARLSGCGARALVATSGFHRRGRLVDIAGLIREVRPNLPGLELLIQKGAPAPDAVAWEDVEAPPTQDLPARMGPDDPLMVIYTSGTTGKPKGAVHTHGSFPLKVAHDAAVHFDIAPDDRFCWPADMGWIAGSLILSCALTRGATLVCYDGAPDFPDWGRMAGLVERHRVTHFGASPTLIRSLAGNMPHSIAADLSSLRLLVTAGEGIDPEHFLWYQRHIGGDRCPVINYTGGTEVTGGLLGNVPVLPIVPAGFNAISPGVSVDVLDDSGRPVREQVGELAILAPFVGMTRAFWQDRERYIETYWSRFPGIWVHGDLAIRREDGVFFLRGRSDDTLKIAGKRLGSAEVEEVLLAIPGVAEAAAIGVEDAAKGQKLVVFVVAAKDAPADFAEAIVPRVERHLGRAFRPAAVHVVAELPKTRSLKIMRRVIRNLYSGQPPGDLTALDNPSALAPLRALAV
ncbi:AMP-binding protein [Roseomonas sp. PWR1]|uniref:acetate--CoA ligase n=1 Tax=Roseomonas nitratireducens TaxID=2820810 RepID=A0ABS4AX77_9PROT|nr:AMP-binding protein [Neoroseomonas nitratireducens]MBP0465418.1 AMP-binding protein [Neoroseomonas nitratireducens]